MNTQRDANPIDDLFRQSFEALPDAPSASGWDAPSKQVWQGIQTQMKSNGSAGFPKAWLLGAAAIACLTAGVWWFAHAPAPTNGNSAPMEHVPTSMPTPNSTTPTTHQAQSDQAQSQPDATLPKAKAAPKVVAPEEPAVSAPATTPLTSEPQHKPGSAMPLPNTKDVPRNTHEANGQQKPRNTREAGKEKEKEN
jgi:hypothetical protein